MATLPSLEHFSIKDYGSVYEPSDDTFLLCDAIFYDKDDILARFFQSEPIVCLEVGSGSGCVITFLSKYLKELNIKNICYATDINLDANQATKRTAISNSVIVEVIRMDLVDSFIHTSSALNKVDILLFNPPYVPTPNEEVGGCGIEAAWAGGENGRVVINRFLPFIEKLLSAVGVCYMILVKDNHPKEIARILTIGGLHTKICIERQAINEGLLVIKIWK